MTTPDVRPGDPRIWTNCLDQSGSRFVKVDCEIGLESTLSGCSAVCLLVAVWWGLKVFWREAGQPISLSAQAFTGPLGALTIAAVLGLARALTDNFYLVDPTHHVIYYHSRFLFWHRARLLLKGRDILAVTTQTRRRSTRFLSWLEHRVVLIGKRGDVVPMSNWRRDARSDCNHAAAELAGQLGCRWSHAPDACRLEVTVEHGLACEAQVPMSWVQLNGGYLRICMNGTLLIGGLIYLVELFIRLSR